MRGREGGRTLVGLVEDLLGVVASLRREVLERLEVRLLEDLCSTNHPYQVSYRAAGREACEQRALKRTLVKPLNPGTCESSHLLP